jgi:hypothetical protein
MLKEAAHLAGPWYLRKHELIWASWWWKLGVGP